MDGFNKENQTQEDREIEAKIRQLEEKLRAKQEEASRLKELESQLIAGNKDLKDRISRQRKRLAAGRKLSST